MLHDVSQSFQFQLSNKIDLGTYSFRLPETPVIGIKFQELVTVQESIDPAVGFQLQYEEGQPLSLNINDDCSLSISQVVVTDWEMKTEGYHYYKFTSRQLSDNQKFFIRVNDTIPSDGVIVVVGTVDIDEK